MAQLDRRVRADGGVSYRVRWRLGGARDGGWQTETFTTENRALAFRLDVEAAHHLWPKGWVKSEGYVERQAEGRTFADVAEDYFVEQDRRIKRGRVKSYTVYRYRRTFELHLLSRFGDAPFAGIEPDDIADWIDALMETFSPKSVKNFHGLLFSIMVHGQKRMHLRADNPCDVTELPEDSSRDARQIRFFLHGEWALFRACLKQDVHLLVDVLLATGVRWGEVTALRVGDITFQGDTAVLHIVRAWSKRAPDDTDPVRAGEGETSSWKLGAPKSKRGRYVMTDGELTGRLREVAAPCKPSEYVFRTREGNPWRYPDFHADRWAPARTEAVKRGLTKHATPHMLRHTTVVWALAAGIPIQVISEMLGHASIQITYDVYGGLIDVRDPALAQAMAAAMTTVRTAIVPGPSREEVETRRTG